MKKKISILFLLFSISVASIPTLWGQTTTRNHSLTIHAGYANMLGGTAGLTNNSNSYEKELCSGFSWDVQYDYRPNPKIGLGILYSGYTANGELTYSSDHIYTHYFAPQLTPKILRTEHFEIFVNAGLGYLFYLNNSTVYGKERRVTGGNIAANIGGMVEYKINNKWGVSLGTQYITSNLRKINVFYHGENTKVKFNNKENKLNLSRLNLSVGVNFHF